MTGTGTEGLPRRERAARVLGIAVAVAIVAAASLVLHWPALVPAAAVGYGVYRLTRGRRRANAPRPRGAEPLPSPPEEDP
jgi:hypothetical protein